MRISCLISTLVLLTIISAEETRKTNFIVILCDNLGYGDVEPFGSKIHRTPHLNRMAKEGRKFTHFYVTAGVCTPSRASIMTGCYAQRVQMHLNPRDGRVLRPVSPYGLHPDETTIAETLKDQGYATALVGKWHLGDQLEFLPNAQGFDYFFGIPYSDDMTKATGERIGSRMDGNRWPPLPLMENERVIEAPVDRNGLTKRHTEVAMKWIEQHQEKPFFLYFPQAMPGSTSKPFTSPEFRGKSKNGPWGDSVEELDWSTGQILDKLVELGIDEHTVVIWTSDNGTPMARAMDSPSRGTNKPLFGRGYTTAEGAFRVPTIMWWPGKVPAGTTCAELSTTMDLLPTFARLAGGQEPQDRKIDGHDVRTLILGEPDAKTPYDVFYYYQRDHLQAIRSGPWKLFLPPGKAPRHPHAVKGKGTKPILFNVVEDIGSQKDISEQHPEVVKRLMGLAVPARADLGDIGKLGKGQRSIGKVSDPQPQTLPNK